jgi:hypothetical protein
VFYKLVEEYSNIITDYSVSDFRRYGSAYSLVANIRFIDGSILYIKDYLFIDGKRKYSYHWQTDEGRLISRWDNSPHHKNISTFPHHKHLPDEVEKSILRSLNEIIKIINETIQKKQTL